MIFFITICPLSVVVVNFFTFSSSSPEPLGNFQSNLAQSIHGLFESLVHADSLLIQQHLSDLINKLISTIFRLPEGYIVLCMTLSILEFHKNSNIDLHNSDKIHKVFVSRNLRDTHGPLHVTLSIDLFFNQSWWGIFWEWNHRSQARWSADVHTGDWRRAGQLHMYSQQLHGDS